MFSRPSYCHVVIKLPNKETGFWLIHIQSTCNLCNRYVFGSEVYNSTEDIISARIYFNIIKTKNQLFKKCVISKTNINFTPNAMRLENKTHH